MDKIAQQTDADFFISTPISDDKALLGVWNKYFSDKHNEIVSSLRTAFQKDQELHAVLSSSFPGFTWPEFAETPIKNSFKEIRQSIDKIAGMPKAMAAPKVGDAIRIFISQYDLMLQHLKNSASKNTEPRPKTKTKTPALVEKIKKLQGLLGVTQTGVWSKTDNNTFLSWLNTKGWGKYIKDGRFVGDINDAINALLIEQVPEGQPSEEFIQRQSNRANKFKKLGL